METKNKTKETKQLNEIIIDGDFVPLGRIAAFASKKALRGNNVSIINTEKIIIIGNPKGIIKRYLEKFQFGIGNPSKPIFFKDPIKMVKRSIRGMVGFKKTTGQEAFKRINCYIGIPKQFEGKEIAKLEKKDPLNYITIEELMKIISQK